MVEEGKKRKTTNMEEWEGDEGILWCIRKKYGIKSNTLNKNFPKAQAT